LYDFLDYNEEFITIGSLYLVNNIIIKSRNGKLLNWNYKNLLSMDNRHKLVNNRILFYNEKNIKQINEIKQHDFKF
jgi:hypothetical protein